MDPRVAAALKNEDRDYEHCLRDGSKYVRLRDEFAKGAMQAYLTDPATGENCTPAEIASSAYAVADAMLAARNS